MHWPNRSASMSKAIQPSVIESSQLSSERIRKATTHSATARVMVAHRGMKGTGKAGSATPKVASPNLAVPNRGRPWATASPEKNRADRTTIFRMRNPPLGLLKRRGLRFQASAFFTPKAAWDRACSFAGGAIPAY